MFQIGALVRLKSGGPVMTVLSSNGFSVGDMKYNGVACTWFSQLSDQHKVESFPPEVLVKADALAGSRPEDFGLKEWPTAPTPLVAPENVSGRPSVGRLDARNKKEEWPDASDQEG